MNFPTQGFGLLKFSNHRLLIEDNEDNQSLIDFIEKVLVKDSYLGIFIDPREVTRDMDEYVNSREVAHSDVNAFLAQQTATLPETETDRGAVNLMRNAANTHSMAAKGEPSAHRFNARDVLAARMAQAAPIPPAPTPIPDSTEGTENNSAVATDAEGNPIATNTDPDAIARAALGIK